MPTRGDIREIDGRIFSKYNGFYWVRIYDPFFTSEKKLDANFDEAIIKTIGHEPYTKNNTIANDIKKHLPNLLWVIPGKIAVVIEIDEDSNYNHETSYEVKKIIDQNKAIRMLEGCANMRVCTIRVNPDAYDGGDIIQKERVDNVARLLHSILDVYGDEIEDEDEDEDDENNRNPLKAIVTPYNSDNDEDEDDDGENKQKIRDSVTFCYYNSKSWNHIDAHKLEFHCEELYLHEPWEWNSREYRAYYYHKTIERRRDYDKKHYDVFGKKRPEATMTNYKYDGNKEKQQEYNRKYNWKRMGVIGDLDAIHDRWLNTINCEACGIRLGGHSSQMKCMDHDHDTGEFRYILCMSCNNHDRWKEVLNMKSPKNSNIL